MIRMNPIEQLRGSSPLVVYIDLKSPYAYIAIEPIRAMARPLGLAVDWRPFTLDIPSYLGSARLDRQGQVVESQRSKSQWGSVRYAYQDARRYARLAGRVLRGTEKIWDSSLAGIGLLWAKRQGREVADRYLDDCYLRFWQRDLDIEDPAVVTAQLAAAGADVEGFAAFLAGAGRREHDALNDAAFAAGIFGVPTLLAADEMWFGREHLPRVAWLLSGRVGPAPDVAYPVPGQAMTAAAPAGAPLRIAIDIRHPQALLAWKPTLALIHDRRLEVEWLPFEAPPLAPPVAVDAGADEARGVRHRRFRAQQLDRELACYADAQRVSLDALYRDDDPALLHLGLLWAGRAGAAPAEAYLEDAFQGYWCRQLRPDDPAAVRALLERAGVPVAGFEAWAAGAGARALAAVRSMLREAGVFQVPAYLLGTVLFQGRAHLPLIRASLPHPVSGTAD
jgi:2-hydroxychromene-2-carboxylate isomerase